MSQLQMNTTRFNQLKIDLADAGIRNVDRIISISNEFLQSKNSQKKVSSLDILTKFHKDDLADDEPYALLVDEINNIFVFLDVCNKEDMNIRISNISNKILSEAQNEDATVVPIVINFASKIENTDDLSYCVVNINKINVSELVNSALTFEFLLYLSNTQNFDEFVNTTYAVVSEKPSELSSKFLRLLKQYDYKDVVEALKDKLTLDMLEKKAPNGQSNTANVVKHAIIKEKAKIARSLLAGTSLSDEEVAQHVGLSLIDIAMLKISFRK
ncbi:MAG: hypothetical protein ATN36_06455 [Epulopiscium sp. Nele67-Bin005]|nr:MAG: hypothetical protein ATN36_06455 [Epulopiscium sp. Nele67-Bin005]